MGFDANMFDRGNTVARGFSKSSVVGPDWRSLALGQIGERRRLYASIGGYGRMVDAATRPLQNSLADFGGAVIVSSRSAASTARLVDSSRSPLISPSLLERLRTPGLEAMMEPARRAILATSRPSNSFLLSPAKQKVAADSTVNWHLQRYFAMNRAAIRDALKKVDAAFGPVVVSSEGGVASDYHPDLRGWRTPDTTSDDAGGLDLVEMWDGAYSAARAVAAHRSTKVFLTAVGPDGRNFLVQVAGTVVGGLILYWLLPR